MARADIEGMSPFFLVTNVDRTVAFYRDGLGFSVTFRQPATESFFAILRRGRAQLFVKSEGSAPPPTPNPRVHPSIRWDAYVFAPDPDGLAAEFAASGVGFSEPLRDTEDGLRGFEIADPDGYVLFFGRPR